YSSSCISRLQNFLSNTVTLYLRRAAAKRPIPRPSHIAFDWHFSNIAMPAKHLHCRVRHAESHFVRESFGNRRLQPVGQSARRQCRGTPDQETSSLDLNLIVREHPADTLVVDYGAAPLLAIDDLFYRRVLRALSNTN